MLRVIQQGKVTCGAAGYSLRHSLLSAGVNVFCQCLGTDENCCVFLLFALITPLLAFIIFGHTFNCCVNLSTDVAYRKGQFIGCVNSIITQFGFAHPVCKLKLLVTHGYSFMVHSCGTSMTMIVKNYILLGTLQYPDYMICLGQPIPGF